MDGYNTITVSEVQILLLPVVLVIFAILVNIEWMRGGARRG
jgi:hypothetical protein